MIFIKSILILILLMTVITVSSCSKENEFIGTIEGFQTALADEEPRERIYMFLQEYPDTVFCIAKEDASKWGFQVIKSGWRVKVITGGEKWCTFEKDVALELLSIVNDIRTAHTVVSLEKISGEYE